MNTAILEPPDGGRQHMEPVDALAAFDRYQKEQLIDAESVALVLHGVLCTRSREYPLRYTDCTPEQHQALLRAAELAIRSLVPAWRELAEQQATLAFLDELRILGLSPHKTRNGRLVAKAEQVRRHLVNARSVANAYCRALNGDYPLTQLESVTVMRTVLGVRDRHWRRVDDGPPFYVCDRCWPGQEDRYPSGVVRVVSPGRMNPRIVCQVCEVRVDGTSLSEVG